MRRSCSARIVSLVLATGLLVGGLAPRAEARTRSIVSARIDGKQFKSTSKRLTFGTYGGLILLVFGSRATGSRVRSLGIGCVPIDLAAVTLPYTCEGNGNYQDVRVRRRPSARAWGTVKGIVVTVESVDGGRVRGTFAGTFDFGNENGTETLPPITVEGGKFDVPLR